MLGRVDSVTKSQSGKSWRVKIGPKFYGANFDSKIDAALGRKIDFDADDGKFGPWVKTWGYINEPAAPPTAAAPPTDAPVTREAVREPRVVDRWWAPFVSNCVAHAIAAGTIKDIVQLRAWAVAAKHAIVAAEDDLDF